MSTTPESQTPDPESERDPAPEPPKALELPKDAEDRLAVLFREYIAQKWVSPVECPVCKTTAWTFTTAGDIPLRYREGKVYTVIPVRCDNCAYMLFFNASRAELFDDDGWPRDPPEVEQEEDTPPEDGGTE